MGTHLEKYELYILGAMAKCRRRDIWDDGGKVRTAVHFIVRMTLWTKKERVSVQPRQQA